MRRNGRQLFMGALSGEIPEVPPVFLRDLTLGLDETGFTTPEVCAGAYDADRSAESVLALHRRLGQDAVVGCIHYVGLEIEALGGLVKYPERGIPSVVRHPFQDTADPEFVILDMRRDPPFPNVARSYRLVGEGLKGSAALVCNIEGPVTKAALLRGMENLALDMFFNKDLAARYVDYATDISIEYLKVIDSQADLDCTFLASASDNPDIFGTEAFLRFTVPNLRRLRGASADLGLPTVFHPHGDLSAPENLPLVEDIIATGVEGFQFAERNDHLALRKAFGKRIALMGGIDAFSTLLLGPVERIVKETEGFLNDFRPWDRYVFMCSCSLHRGMPLAHVDAMMDSVLGFAKKDI
ncbi:MAG: Methylcobamide:CoM methyltransferase MtaA [Methanomassiliicoccales archaeon PtaB.Bin215]|nr:MAG: Methylcobamide:CoM methyltransferase MtaA [Methanomassiliicoccales archaeon PtaB.Bin215]